MDWDGVLSLFVFGTLIFMLVWPLARRRPRSDAQARLEIPLRGPETWWQPSRDGPGFDPGSLVRLGPVALRLDARLAALAGRAAVSKLSVRWRDIEILWAPDMPDEVRRSAAVEATRIARALEQAPRADGDVVKLALEHLEVASNDGAYRAGVLAAVAQAPRWQPNVALALDRARSDPDPRVALAAARALDDLELERALVERLREREGALALADDARSGGLSLGEGSDREELN